jgi:hypothetical protein
MRGFEADIGAGQVDDQACCKSHLSIPFWFLAFGPLPNESASSPLTVPCQARRSLRCERSVGPVQLKIP